MRELGRSTSHLRLIAAVGVAACAVVLGGAAAAPGAVTDVAPEVHHDVSPPLHDIPTALRAGPGGKREHPLHVVPTPPSNGSQDTVVQTSLGSAAAPAAQGFEGVGLGFSGPQGTFNMQWAPPDTNGAVGPSNYVQIVNTGIAIFDKSGTVLYGPVPTNTIWSGFGGGCETNDDGDGTVVYDRISDRWIIQQFSVSTKPYLECVAVSKTGDPTGQYYRYSFGGFGRNFPDYPKLSVWPDAYYATFNLFRNGSSYVGPEACAYDRASMLNGLAATQQCFQLGSSNGSVLPSDLDGPTAPPAGSPSFLLSFGTNSLRLWKFHVDWANTANTTVTGPTTISVAGFSSACGGGTCIPQAGTTQKLDSLADRLMYRLAYRNFGDHESLVVTHSVTAGSSTGIRWYELRSPNGTPTVYQQGTYAPDSNYRWMGSAAMDGSGDIALGYSVSSASMNPGIRYTARLAGDPLGTMTQGEGTLVDGTGSQTGGLSRWGDYSSMQIDPSDDCTFWYTTEYLASNGNWNWHTRIGSFKLAGCGSSGGTAPSVSTGAATSVGSATATLNGSGNPNGQTATGWFRYSTTNGTCNGSFGTATSPTSNLGSGSSSQPFTFNLTGLSPSTTYYYCAVANNVSGTTYGAGTVSFKTGGAPTSVTTSAATNVGSASATLNGSANPNGLSTNGFFRYSTTNGTCNSSFGTATAPTSSLGSGSSSQPYTYGLTGLTPSTTYYYCAVASNGSGTTYAASTVNFTTSSSAPPNVVVNGDFETGSLSGWGTQSTASVLPFVVSSGAHGGTYAAEIGAASPFVGNSVLKQTLTIPAGTSTLTFWYQPHCTDTLTNDQIKAQIRDSTGSTILANFLNVCSNSGTWTQVTFDTSPWAGQTVLLRFLVNDDGNSATTYALVDDVTLG
jgi:hypothetical protein